MEHASPAQGKTEAKGVYTLLRQRHRLLASRQPLVRIAKITQRPVGKAVTHHPSVLAIEPRRSAVLLGIIERYPLRQCA